MRFYNIIEKEERKKALTDLEEAVTDNDKNTRKVVAIAGGDGSLAPTIKYLRTSQLIDTALVKGKIYFVTLPYGTGNDGPQTFGWGSSPLTETWNADLESLMRDMITS